VAAITGACPLSRKVLLLLLLLLPTEGLWSMLLFDIFMRNFEVLVLIKGWEGF
jgi:hypothetical protein